MGDQSPPWLHASAECCSFCHYSLPRIHCVADVAVGKMSVRGWWDHTCTTTQQIRGTIHSGMSALVHRNKTQTHTVVFVIPIFGRRVDVFKVTRTLRRRNVMT